MTSTEQPPKLTFIISDDMGKCGLKNHNFVYEVGEELEQIVYTKLLKSKPKMYANYTHAILCGNGGGRSSTFAWFFKNKINCRPYDRSSSKWISKKATCLNDSVN